jgi:putative lipoprotein
MTTLFGTVALPGDAPAGAATVRVSVEDTTLQDVAAVRLAEAVLPGIDLSPGGRLPFAIDVDTVPPGATVRVHVDLAGDGDVASGDLLTVQAVPVDVLGPSWDAAGEVPVRTV